MNGTKNSSDDFDETREQLHRQMLSAVSHDLKTPLATIIGSLEVYTRMDEKLAQDKKLMLIKSALGEAYRLDNFVTNILDMAKLENGMVNVNKERCDIKTIVQDSIVRIGPRVERGTITLKPQETGETTIITDPMLLGKAVSIVVDNALKHAGAHPVITISYGVKETHGYIQIADNGVGIAEKRMEDIFSKYTRLSKGDQQNAGTGLGLCICRHIMRLLSGTVDVENAAEGGAIFTLSFSPQ
jgi:two-component system sensor histidine kinase KdpD